MSPREKFRGLFFKNFKIRFHFANYSCHKKSDFICIIFKMNLISAKWLRSMGACPLVEPQKDEGHSSFKKSDFIKVAVTNPCDEFLLEKLRRELNVCHIQASQSSAYHKEIEAENQPAIQSEIQSVIQVPPPRIIPQKFTQGQIRQLIAQSPLAQNPSQELSEESLKGALKSWESEPIINLVDSLMEQAMSQGATDIHIEPDEKDLRIRFRKDGLLEEFKRLPLWASDPILVRLKILAEIDITDKRISHDGSFTYNGLRDIACVRVSTLPVQGGEKCVLRILPQKSDSCDAIKGLASLNLSNKITEYLQTIFNFPQGLFLVTGPTGSGKTTTLHRGLEEIIQRKINVVTIEDPVEYTLKGANQVEVNEKCGFTFASALRSILRQDPDVILVGEIRDSETAKTAIRAAQTGHLVVSTLHTNSARAAFSRLKDLGVTQNLLDDSLLGIMAQRLVRKKSGGRRAIVELLLPDGTFVDGSLQDSARNLVQQGIVSEDEVHRVIGKSCYIDGHEDF